MTALSLSASSQPVKGARLFFLPIVVGILAALAMVSVYLGILSALQSPAHATEQLVADTLWVGLVAVGFGTQVGMYIHLRVVIHAAKVAGATAMTGAGTGTSTLGMLACCAHHLTDIAPLVVQAGVDPNYRAGVELTGRAFTTTWVRMLTPFFNIYGTVTLTGGALYSAWLFWRKRVLPNRMVGNILIAAGAMAPAFGGVLNRFGLPGLYIGEFIGVLLMYVGFLQATAVVTQPSPAVAQAVQSSCAR